MGFKRINVEPNHDHWKSGHVAVIHDCINIPQERGIENTAWFRWLDSHHHLHHKRHFNNLNVVLPLADFIFGTLLLPADEHIPSLDRAQGARQVGLLLWKS